MSHDDFSLHEAAERLNGLAAMLLETGRATPVGALVGPVSRLTKGLKPTAGLGWGIVVGSAAVLAVSAILKNRGAAAGSAIPPAGDSATPAAAPPAAPVASAAAASPAAASPPVAEGPGAEAAAPVKARAPRRKSSRKPTGGTL